MKKYYVYELVNQQGYVEDVGETYTPDIRMKQHTKLKPTSSGIGKWYGRDDLIMNIVKEFDNRTDALKLEGQLKLVHGIEWTERIRSSKGGSIQGPKNVESGHFESIKTTESCSKGGKKGGPNAFKKQNILLICPYCNKEGIGRVMYRWHFDKCKYKI